MKLNNKILKEPNKRLNNKIKKIKIKKLNNKVNKKTNLRHQKRL